MARLFVARRRGASSYSSRRSPVRKRPTRSTKFLRRKCGACGTYNLA